MNPPAGRIAPQTDGLEKFLNSCHTTFTAAIVTHFLFGLCPCGAPSVCLFSFCFHPSISNSKQHCLASAFGFPACRFVLHFYFFACTYIWIYIYIILYYLKLNHSISIFTAKPTCRIPRQVSPETSILPDIHSSSLVSYMTIPSNFSDTTSLSSGSHGGTGT